MGPGGMTPGDGIFGLMVAPTTALEGSAGGAPDSSTQPAMRLSAAGPWGASCRRLEKMAVNRDR